MLEQIQEIINSFTEDNITITEDTNLNTDLGFSSMDYFSLIIEIEETFGARIPDSAIKELRTVGDLIACIKAHS